MTCYSPFSVSPRPQVETGMLMMALRGGHLGDQEGSTVRMGLKSLIMQLQGIHLSLCPLCHLRVRRLLTINNGTFTRYQKQASPWDLSDLKNLERDVSLFINYQVFSFQMHTSVLPACSCVMCVQCQRRSEESTGLPGAVVTFGYEPPCQC